MNELDFIVALMKENYEAVGFLTVGSVLDYLHNRSHILIPHKGYLLYENPKPYRVLRIAQACVDYDLRERGYGRQMVEQVIAHASTHYASEIILRCAEDLEANDFWRSMGFEHYRTYHPNNARKRAINGWRKIITPGLFRVEESR